MEDLRKDLFTVRATSAEKDEYIITIGNKRASEHIFKTQGEAEQYIDNHPYELIINLCFACFEAVENMKRAKNHKK